MTDMFIQLLRSSVPTCRAPICRTWPSAAGALGRDATLAAGRVQEAAGQGWKLLSGGERPFARLAGGGRRRPWLRRGREAAPAAGRGRKGVPRARGWPKATAAPAAVLQVGQEAKLVHAETAAGIRREALEAPPQDLLLRWPDEGGPLSGAWQQQGGLPCYPGSVEPSRGSCSCSAGQR